MKITIETDGTCAGTTFSVDGEKIRMSAQAVGFDAIRAAYWQVTRALTNIDGLLLRDSERCAILETVPLAKHVQQLRDGSYVPIRAYQRSKRPTLKRKEEQP